MSRIAKTPITIPNDVEVLSADNTLTVKGKLGQLAMPLHPLVQMTNKDNVLTFALAAAGKKDEKFAWAQAGTTRAIVANFIKGVSTGWEKKLTLIGVGYRAKIKGTALDLSLGFSHPVSYKWPADIRIETPSETEIIIKGIDKQKVGQVAAKIRAYRPPEPYKGKGVRYSDEQVIRKETKKK